MGKPSPEGPGDTCSLRALHFQGEGGEYDLRVSSLFFPELQTGPSTSPGAERGQKSLSFFSRRKFPKWGRHAHPCHSLAVCCQLPQLHRGVRGQPQITRTRGCSSAPNATQGTRRLRRCFQRAVKCVRTEPKFSQHQDGCRTKAKNLLPVPFPKSPGV